LSSTVRLDGLKELLLVLQRLLKLIDLLLLAGKLVFKHFDFVGRTRRRGLRKSGRNCRHSENRAQDYPPRSAFDLHESLLKKFRRTNCTKRGYFLQAYNSSRILRGFC
jgi:hypothetical protein